jgi:hypothetical protein
MFDNFEIKITPSANKHGVDSDSILYSLEKCIYDEILENEPNKTLAIGFNKNGELIEIVFSIVSENKIVVFHAMKCRKSFIERIENNV